MADQGIGAGGGMGEQGLKQQGLWESMGSEVMRQGQGTVGSLWNSGVRGHGPKEMGACDVRLE